MPMTTSRGSKPADTRREQSGTLRQLLYTRRQVAQLLGGVDVSTVRRLEKEGRLKGKRLTKSTSGMVFFTAENVQEVVDEAIDASC